MRIEVLKIREEKTHSQLADSGEVGKEDWKGVLEMVEVGLWSFQEFCALST